MVRSMKKRLLSNRGITLIEMMIGVVIVGVAATMAVPRFQAAMDRIEFRSTTRDVVSLVRYARSEAISKKDRYGVYFDYGGRTATFFVDIGSDPTAFEPYSDSVVKVDSLGDKNGSYLDYVVTTLANNVVIFSPNGSASSGGSIYTVVMTENIVGVADINILQSTGRVKHDTYIWTTFDIETP